MARKRKTINVPAPYLKRIWLDPSRIADRKAYLFCLPLLHNDFELRFDRPITIIVGENGIGKSTLLECIAVFAGYDEAGGGKGYRPVDHSHAIEAMAGTLSYALRAAWLPKITNGWFFRAESFYSVARYLDEAALDDPLGGPPPDFLSHSHGEGFLRFFRERCQKQGIFIFDEPESALSPSRQLEFLEADGKNGRDRPLPGDHGHALADADGLSQRDAAADDEVWPGAGVKQTDHFRVMRGILLRPEGVRGGGV